MNMFVYVLNKGAHKTSNELLRWQWRNNVGHGHQTVLFSHLFSCQIDILRSAWWLYTDRDYYWLGHTRQVVSAGAWKELMKGPGAREMWADCPPGEKLKQSPHSKTFCRSHVGKIIFKFYLLVQIFFEIQDRFARLLDARGSLGKTAQKCAYLFVLVAFGAWTLEVLQFNLYMRIK